MMDWSDCYGSIRKLLDRNRKESYADFGKRLQGNIRQKILSICSGIIINSRNKKKRKAFEAAAKQAEKDAAVLESYRKKFEMRKQKAVSGSRRK